ncbi:MAG: hypothetical protein RI538_02225 [Salibaculum sp.]|jgi:hypothetical protein|nr:hypothetical protein [Salibaculum sp.]MDR9427674.1 hypothetical protein [Salibaculum sp.]MDR9481584.1 hypothetical protein [Salibaculum sp.]
MNANRLMNMVMRIVMRKIIGGGINKGMQAIGKRRKAQPRKHDDTRDGS